MPDSFTHEFRETVAQTQLLSHLRTALESAEHLKNEDHIVLCVEDNIDISTLIQMLLEHEGQQVIVVDNVHDAAQFLAQADLIVVDLMLPGTDGLELIRAIRLLGMTTPIIVFTATSTRDHEALAAGANHVIVKTHTDDLLDLVALYLNIHRDDIHT